MFSVVIAIQLLWLPASSVEMDFCIVYLRDSAALAAASAQAYPVVTGVVLAEFEHSLDYLIYRPAGIPEFVLINTLEGAGSFRSESGARIDAPPASITVIPARRRHDFRTAGPRPWKFQFAQIRPRQDWEPLLDWPETIPGVRQIRADAGTHARIRESLAAAVAHLHSVERYREMFAMNHLEQALLWCATQNPLAPHIDPRLTRALALIEDDLGAELGVPQLARASTLSTSRLAHLFRTQLGTSPQKYIERRRIDAAANLLDMTALSIAEIADRVGYSSSLYFSTRFRLLTGMSPTAYRHR